MKSQSKKFFIATKYVMDGIWYLSIAVGILFMILFTIQTLSGKLTPNVGSILVPYSGSLKETFETTNGDTVEFVPTYGKIMFYNFKTSQIVTVIIFCSIAVLLYFSGLFQIRKFLKNMVSDSPFNQQNIKILKIISLYFVFVNILVWISDWIILKETEQIQNYVQTFRYNFPQDIQYILIGGIIFLFAKIFEYGYEIQSENNSFL